MATVNENFQRLESGYLFAEIARRATAVRDRHPDVPLLSLGIGDVTQPWCAPVIAALHRGVDDLAVVDRFRGYGPYEGYEFLREAVANRYRKRGAAVSADDVFITDGAKNSLADLLDLFAAGSTALIPDPVYPAYLDATLLAGNVPHFLRGAPDNRFLPAPPAAPFDLVYLCSPNNPTGAVLDRAGLTDWVDYANGCGAVLLFDAAYERFIADPALPHSIFEIPGAETCAIEICSLSKTAGFTGVRMGYTVIPQALSRSGFSLCDLWRRRIAALYNGAPYLIQRGALAVFTPDGEQATASLLSVYRKNAALLREAVSAQGLECWGGIHAPYVWFRCPGGLSSWALFDRLLAAGVIATPGAGFGAGGEGFMRLSAFGRPDETACAADRLSAALGNLK